MNQAEKNTAVCAGPRPLTLGGRVFLLSPPTLADRAAIGQEGTRLLAGGPTPLGRIVNDPAFKLLPLSCQVAAATEAAKIQAVGDESPSGLQLAEELGKPKLLAFAIWVLAKKNDPGILTLEEIRPLITEDNAGAVFLEFVEASGILDLGPNSAGASG